MLFSADYTPDPGGIAIHVHELARALADLGSSVTVVGGCRLTNVGGWNTRSPTGLREHRIPRVGPPGLRGLAFVARAAATLRRGSWNWDVVHFHNFFPDGVLVGTWPPARARIMTNHSSQFLVDRENGRKRRRLMWLTRRVRGIIGPSRELAEESAWIARPGQSVAYIPNGVDAARFTPGPNREPPQALRGLPPGTPIILAVRRHDPSKSGLPHLVRAMADVRRIRPEAVLFLAGDGPETPHLKRLGNELGLGSGLRFLGSVSNADLPPLYKAAWVSILPSLYEAVSLSGLESLACGVPVVGTRVGGIPEIVLDGITGILVPPRSPEALAAAILDLVGNAERRHAMGEEARRLVVREYTWEIIAKRTLEFYGRCMETSP